MAYARERQQAPRPSFAAAPGLPRLVKGLSRRIRARRVQSPSISGFLPDQDIDLKLNAHVTAIDTGNRCVLLAHGSRHDYDALLLATGAEPTRLDIPGGNLPHVLYFRTVADSRALLAKALASNARS